MPHQQTRTAWNSPVEWLCACLWPSSRDSPGGKQTIRKRKLHTHTTHTVRWWGSRNQQSNNNIDPHHVREKLQQGKQKAMQGDNQPRFSISPSHTHTHTHTHTHARTATAQPDLDLTIQVVQFALTLAKRGLCALHASGTACAHGREGLDDGGGVQLAAHHVLKRHTVGGEGVLQLEFLHATPSHATPQTRQCNCNCTWLASNPATRSNPIQSKPSQTKPSQAKPSQAKPSQAKPNRATNVELAHALTFSATNSSFSCRRVRSPSNARMSCSQKKKGNHLTVSHSTHSGLGKAQAQAQGQAQRKTTQGNATQHNAAASTRRPGIR